MKKMNLLFTLLIAGCADRPPPPTGHSSHTLTIGWHTRGYGVYAPTGHTGARPLPLVVILHGGGGTGRGMLRDTGWQEKADAEHFLVAYPDGLARDPSRPARFRGNPQTWNDGSGRFTHGENAELVDDVAFLDAMLDAIIAAFSVDERRIYVTGFSNGASMAFRFGEQSRRRIAAIAPVAGACWNPSPRLSHPVPLCYVTGDCDPLNPMGGGVITLPGATPALNATPKPPVAESLARWCGALGESPALAQREIREDGASVMSNGKRVIVVTVPGHGHYWPGGPQNLPPAIAGPFRDTFNATGFIWAFFANPDVYS